MKRAFSYKKSLENNIRIAPKVQVLVDIDGKNLANISVDEIDTLKMTEIKEKLKGVISKVKNKRDKNFNE